MSERVAAQRAERGEDMDRAAVAVANGPVMRRQVRSVPRSLALRLLFGWKYARVFWLIAALGMVFPLAFLPQIDLRSADYDRRATATVTAIEATSSWENEQRIHRVRYTFADEAGATREGASYTVSPPEALSTWDVEYDSGDPSESRLVGMRRQPFPAPLLMMLLIPMYGLVGGMWFLVRGRRALDVLRCGHETSGTLIDSRRTIFRTIGKRVLALTFEYEVGSRRHTTVVRTVRSPLLEDDEREPMLYDPAAPERAVVLDDLPGAPRVGASGALETGRIRVLPYLLAPVACAGLVVATVIVMIAA